MTGYLICSDGETYRLPVLTEWRLSYGLGEPCDAFSVQCLYEPDMLRCLGRAYRFRGEEQGKTVFYGVVDEFEISAGEQGRRAAISGRGMGALLLDNECEAVEYSAATIDTVLSRYAAPYGIVCGGKGSFPPVSGYTVSSGESAWKALKGFTMQSAGITPRFDRYGRLLLTEPEGGRLVIDDGTAACELKYRETRYGVISQVLVKNKTAGISVTVENSEFKNNGGMCRRVMNVSRGTGSGAMKYTGKYQIDKSMVGRIQCSLTLPELFAAWPGDRAALKLAALGISGDFTVSGTEVWADAVSAGTELTLIKKG